MSTEVLDLSHHNTVASWDAIKKSGIVGIIHKASEGSNYADPTYNSRRAEATKAGLLWGAYHFMRPGDQKAHAAWFLACATPKPNDLICADYEDDAMSLDDLQAFLAAIYSLVGRRAVIYSGHLIKEQVGNRIMPGLAEHQLWIAQYTTASQPEWPKGTWPSYFLWQFTDTGSAPGVTGGVDCNTSPLEEDVLRACWNGSALTPPAPPEPETDQPMVTVMVTVHAPPGIAVRVVQA